jgi:hypothetical protein
MPLWPRVLMDGCIAPSPLTWNSGRAGRAMSFFPSPSPRGRPSSPRRGRSVPVAADRPAGVDRPPRNTTASFRRAARSRSGARPLCGRRAASHRAATRNQANCSVWRRAVRGLGGQMLLDGSPGAFRTASAPSPARATAPPPHPHPGRVAAGITPTWSRCSACDTQPAWALRPRRA